MRHTSLFLAIASASLLALPATTHAQAAAQSSARAPELLDTIIVTGTRTERARADVPATVDAIDRERMDDHLVHDLKDLFRYEPGITVGNGFGRFGIADIRVRGLGGNRVRIETDGITVPDAFSIGSFSNANRNFVDLDTLKRVEVVRGPSSSLYGSDALGGVVSFTTKDPSDYLGTGRDAYAGFKLGYESDWAGLFAGATAAFGGDRWSGLIAVSHRQGRETENQADIGGIGSARTLPNPQQRDGRSLLAKLIYSPSATQRVRLTVEGNEDETATDVLTSRGLQPLTGANNIRVLGDDHQTRMRVSLTHEVDALDWFLADSLDWQAYRQDSETTQDTVEERTLPPPTLRDRRDRSFNFDQRVHGLQANLRKSLEGTGVVHDLAYGFDLSRTDTRQKRDGRRTFLSTGVVTPVVPPDTFPVRDFPVSRTTNAAAYVQDDMAFAQGRFRLVPSVRVDHYRLEPRIDPIFAEDNPGIAVARLTETSVSPKLGAVWHVSDRWSVFGGYARGFRSPPYNDVNIGFTNLQFGYTAIANPDLRPETSDGFEAGVRFAGDVVHASLASYYNRYRDFIESQRFIGFDAGGLMVFQSQNIDEATIRGAELKVGVDLGAVAQAWDGWSFRGAASWARGQDDVTGVPLDGIDPPTAALGMGYDRDAWGVELAGRFARHKTRTSDPAYFRQPGFGVLDLYAHWDFAPGAKLNVGLLNLGDRRYIDAGDLPPGVPLASGSVDRYTAPGRSLSMSLAFAW